MLSINWAENQNRFETSRPFELLSSVLEVRREPVNISLEKSPKRKRNLAWNGKKASRENFPLAGTRESARRWKRKRAGMKRRQRGARALNRSEPFCARRLRKGKARISLRTLLLLSSFVFLCLERHRRHCDAPRLRRAKFDALRAALGGGEKASLASPESFSKLKKRFCVRSWNDSKDFSPFENVWALN